MNRKVVKLLGFNIDTFDLESAVIYAKNLIESKAGGQIVTINPEMIEYGIKNEEFAGILNSADLVIPDGVGVKLGLKVLGVETQRVAGIEFSHRMIQECAKNGFPVAFIGAKLNIITKAVENLQNENKNLNVVYIKDGYYQNQNDVLWALGEKKPQFVLVALGSPKQELFIREYRKFHPETVMVGVGGSFDVWSGKVRRAPKLFQKLGLEWLYRTLKEPKRLKRIFPTLPRFILRVLLSKRTNK